MNEERFATFEEFWPFYVLQHAQKLTRTLHFVGTTAALACVATAALTRNPRWLLLAPVAGYGPAWFSHFFIEKNRPATFTYPTWSLLADLKMWSLIVSGDMDEEVERAIAASASVAEAAKSPPNKVRVAPLNGARSATLN